MPTRNQSTSRRSFIKSVGAAGAIAAAAPMILRADDKPGGKAPVLGEGAHQYEAFHGWAQVPEGMRFGNTHMVQEDAQGRIFVHHTGGPDSVFIFDPEGKFIKSWGKQWCPGAHGMQLRKETDGEFLYLATTGQARVVKADLDGKVVFDLGYPKDAKNAKGEACYGDGKGYSPTNIAFGPNGDFYVADGYGRSYVHQYNIKGEYIRTWGGKGSADGELNCPHGIWCDTRDAANPTILVADRSNERLQWFTLDGRHVKTVKPEGNAFRHPCHFDQRGTDLLLPGLHGRVSILDKDNKQIAVLGDNNDPKTRGQNGATPEMRKPGVFCTPHGACFDRAGNIYVTEWVRDGRVIKLRHVG
jgi:DNA-binding beta-propeller fold protein YncE